MIFPDQVHIGDRFNDSATEDEAAEWDIVSRPVTSVENEMNAMSKKEADAGVEGPMARRGSIELRGDQGASPVRRMP